MGDRREQIMESAIRWFSNKGYFSTSVQEIADDCGISKGLLYKHFESKEDLLMEVFKYNHEKMVNRANLIKLDPSLSKQERFKEMVIVELEGMVENKDFFNVLSKSLPINKNKQFFPLLKKIRGELFNWHKDSVYQAYGDKIKDNIWDVTTIFQAIVKEFTYILNQGNVILDIEIVADFIVNSVDTIVEGSAFSQPVLTDEMMKEFDDLQKGVEPKSLQEKLQEVLQKMKGTIDRLPYDVRERQDISDSIDLLDVEMKADTPRPFLVRALVTYLYKYSELENYVKVVENLLDLK